MFRSFCFLLFSCLAVLIPSEAFCHTLQNSQNLPLLIREDAPAKTPHSSFTIQDNSKLYSIPKETSKILLPVSDNFISPDIIDSNLPIFSLFRTPSVSDKDPFANILYSNLRIKKLLQEYAEVQERTRELLGSVSVQSSIDMMIENSLSSPGPELSTDTKVEIDKLLLAFKQLQQSISNITPNGHINVSIASLPHTTDTTLKSTFSLIELQTILNKPNGLPNIQQMTYAGSNKFPGNGQYNSQPDTSFPHTSQQSNPESSYSVSAQVELPWILDLPFKLFDFFLAHKLVFLITVFLFLGLLNIIFGSRS